MSGVTRTLRIGDYLNSMLLHFSTPELRELQRVSRQKIAEFTDDQLQGKGCNAGLIIFDLFEYAFVLTYHYKAREWVLELDQTMGYPPPTNTKPPRRRSQSKSGGSTRAGAVSARRRRPPRATAQSRVDTVIRDTKGSAAYKTWIAFLRGDETAAGMDAASWREEWAQLKRELRALKELAAVSLRSIERWAERTVLHLRSTCTTPAGLTVNVNSPTFIEMFARLDKTRGSFGERTLVRKRLSGPLAFVGDVFSFESQSIEGPWDSSSSGEFPQLSEQTAK